MKQASAAYRSGDLARLLEIEASMHGRSAGEASPADSTLRRCADLERMNRELAGQLKALERALADLRQQSPTTMARVMGLDLEHGADPAAVLIEALRAETERLRQLHDFVASFRDGRIDLSRFLAGPPPLPGSRSSYGGGDDAYGDDDGPGDFAALMDLLRQEIEGGVTRRRRRRRR